MKKILTSTLILIFLFINCAYINRNISKSKKMKKYWGGYKHLGKYRLKKKLYLGKTDNRFFTEPKYFFSLNKIDETLDQTIGIVKKGTIIETYKLVKSYQLSWWFGYQTDIYMYARILTGKYANVRVDISGISNGKYINGFLIYEPDFDILQKKIVIQKQ